MADRKDRMALLTRYSSKHNIWHEAKPSLNLNVEQWAADALIESYGLPACYDLLEYYFKVSSNPSWSYFAYNAENILQAKIAREKDDAERKERRKLARKWLGE